MLLLENLRTLKENMVESNWTICSFLFTYREIEYIVLVKRFVRNIQRDNEYALVQLHFMRSDDLVNDLLVEANSQKLLVDAHRLRDFFGIEYAENLGSLLQQFTARLGEFIPTEIPQRVTDIEQRAMVSDLSRSDAEDPNRIYCSHVRRNPNNGQRSVFNSDKTKLLRPSLFQHFQNDNNISFCYSDQQHRENTDADILRKFADNADL